MIKKRMKILFIGFGNVAKEMARIFTERKLYPALDISPEVIGIFTKRHGGLENSSGICLDTVLTELRQNDRLTADERELSRRSRPLRLQKNLITMCWWNCPRFL